MLANRPMSLDLSFTQSVTVSGDSRLRFSTQVNALPRDEKSQIIIS